jgi:hypothetical protein
VIGDVQSDAMMRNSGRKLSTPASGECVTPLKIVPENAFRCSAYWLLTPSDNLCFGAACHVRRAPASYQ